MCSLVRVGSPSQLLASALLKPEHSEGLLVLLLLNCRVARGAIEKQRC